MNFKELHIRFSVSNFISISVVDKLALVTFTTVCIKQLFIIMVCTICKCMCACICVFYNLLICSESTSGTN